MTLPASRAPVEKTWLDQLGELFRELPIGVQIGLNLGLVLLLLSLVVYGWFRLPARWRKTVRAFLTVGSGVAAVWLGIVALGLPEGRSVRFSVTHQLIRAGATLSATVFTILLLSAAVPLILSVLERGSFRSFVAARHLRAKKSGFLTVISGLSILGVGLSSFKLCAVISVMGGFGADLKEKILNNDAQVRIESTQSGGIEDYRAMLDRVREVPGVRGAMPVITGEVMASSSTSTAGMLVRGIDPTVVSSVVDIPKKVEVGDFKYLEDPYALRDLPPGTPIGVSKGGEVYYQGPRDNDSGSSFARADQEAYPGVILGSELAENLHAFVGDVLTLISPMGDLGPMGIMPKTRRFRVAGIFHSGLYEYDVAHAYMTLEAAADLLDMGFKVSSIDVRVEDLGKVDAVGPRIKRALADLPGASEATLVRDWREMNKNLFTALELEKLASFVVLSIAIAVASFCIICTLLLMVTEKSKEIAILKAMGSSDGTVLRLFLTEGVLIGSVGTVIGVAAGYVAMKGLAVFGVWLDPEVYYVERLPVNVETVDYLIIGASALFITTLATLYPALAASRLLPVEGIRHE